MRLASLLLLLLMSAAACASPGTVLRGKVAVAGNEPFSYLSLRTSEGTAYRLTGEAAAGLERDYQGRRVSLEGKILEEAAGPGHPARFEVEKILPDGPGIKDPD